MTQARKAREATVRTVDATPEKRFLRAQATGPCARAGGGSDGAGAALR